MSSTSNDHVEVTPSTSENKVNGHKRRSKFPCRLCEGDHAIHRYPFIDEAKRFLDNHPASLLWLPLGYKKLLPSPSLAENLIDTPLRLVETSTIEDKPSASTPDQSQQVETAVDPVLSSEGLPLDDIVTKENENDTIQILFVNTESDEHGGNIPVPLPQEGSSSNIYPTIYSVPPPSNLVVSFDWNLLGRPRLPSNVPFRIIVKTYRMVMVGTIIDEGASVSILSSTSWKALGSASILPEIRNLTGLNKGTSRPLGILQICL